MYQLASSQKFTVCPSNTLGLIKFSNKNPNERTEEQTCHTRYQNANLSVEMLEGCGCCEQKTIKKWPLKDKVDSHRYSHKTIHVILKYDRKHITNWRASFMTCQSALREVKVMILTCSSSLTLSIGATAVLEIAAATPPAKKSLAKEMAASAMAALNT